jgi:hypothetical protein
VPYCPRLSYSLHRRVQSLESELAAAEAAPVAAYRPRLAGDIAAIDAPAADILRQLPGIASVEVRVACPKPTHRIVHFRDWHWVPRDLCAADLAHTYGRAFSAEEIDMHHRELSRQAELVSAPSAARRSAPPSAAGSDRQRLSRRRGGRRPACGTLDR